VGWLAQRTSDRGRAQLREGGGPGWQRPSDAEACLGHPEQLESCPPAGSGAGSWTTAGEGGGAEAARSALRMQADDIGYPFRRNNLLQLHS
jgi:hypothetical protein